MVVWTREVADRGLVAGPEYILKVCLMDFRCSEYVENGDPTKDPKLGLSNCENGWPLALLFKNEYFTGRVFLYFSIYLV